MHIFTFWLWLSNSPPFIIFLMLLFYVSFRLFCLLWSSGRISGWPSLSCLLIFLSVQIISKYLVVFFIVSLSSVGCFMWTFCADTVDISLQGILFLFLLGFNGPGLGFVLSLLLSKFTIYHIGHANVTLVSTNVTGLRFFLLFTRPFSSS